MRHGIISSNLFFKHWVYTFSICESIYFMQEAITPKRVNLEYEIKIRNKAFFLNNKCSNLQVKLIKNNFFIFQQQFSIMEFQNKISFGVYD